MFKNNNQPKLFSFETELLGQKQQQKMKDSKEKWFYKLVFRNINEDDFKPLYSNILSRPNAPVNILVSALILKELRGLSYDELMESIMFDLRFKIALGLQSIDETPFVRSTLFNFQNRILHYQEQTKINLFEKVFDNLSDKEIKLLSLKTNIQRADSTLISSNIRNYSRIQLLIEVLLRLYKILDASDKQELKNAMKPYLKKSSEKYVYDIKSGDLTHELSQLGELYNAVYMLVKDNSKYIDTKEYANYQRVFKDHFIVVNQQVEVKPNSELHSGMLQAPDDSEATYRKKRKEETKGFTITATETANPDNDLQLINDIVVKPNNIDDSKILEERIDKIKDKTPDLEELHTDGGYGSENNDKKMEELGVTQITTAIRGKQSEVELKIEQISQEPEIYTVECPHQKQTSTPTKQRHKVRFETRRCESCPLKDNCRIFRAKGRYYFKHGDHLKNKRNNNINTIPKERQKLRPNVEATMNEFKSKTNGGKVKVRGLFKINLFAYALGVSINFGRIYRYLIDIKVNNEIKAAIISEIAPLFSLIWNKINLVKHCKAQILAFFRPSPNQFYSTRFSATLNYGGF